jgi:two-component system alkaline phosphatase synthesis response regulator PhoP
MENNRILIVDDDPAVVKEIRSTLEEAGYNVYSVNTAEEVFDKLKQISPDLIILDLVLAQESGFKVAKEIKSNIKYRNIPIIVVSLRKEDLDKRVAALSGAMEYLEKPVNPQELLFHVKDILSRKEGP